MGGTTYTRLYGGTAGEEAARDVSVKPCCLRGYRTYIQGYMGSRSWRELVCDSKPNNDRDRYAVTVIMNQLLH